MRKWWMMAAIAASASTPGIAQKGADANVIARLRACRANADPIQRLACFDEASSSLDAAITRKELVILDKQEVSRTSRSLFGLPLPNLKLLTGNNGELDVKQIDLKVSAVRPVSYQKYDIQVESGAVWRNVDLMVEPPRTGDVIHLSKGLAGSFFMKAPRLQPVRAARVR